MTIAPPIRLSAAAAASLTLATAVVADIRITEYMYSGADGEFIEITNTGATAVDLTGWSYDDSARVPGTFSIGSIGMLAPGASAVITESGADAFRTAWGLDGSVAVVGDLGRPYGNNYGRNDTIVLYDATDAIVDILQYGDQDFPGSIRTQNISGWTHAAGLGANDPFAWQFSVAEDEQGSFVSVAGDLGSPGTFTLVAAGAVSLGMVLTEYMYSGPGGEFVEFTNLSDAPIDMTGWQLDDNNLLGGPNGPFDVSAFGVVAPGESVIVTESAAADFRANWGLAESVKVIGDLGKGDGNNLSRNDEINIYDAGGELVDRLTFGDEDFPGSIRTQNASGWVLAESIGMNDAYGWVLSELGDAQPTVASAGADLGSPGTHAMPRPKLVGDFNDDGVVDGDDLGTLLGFWGPCAKGDPCEPDLNDDGTVDGDDLGTLLGNWS